MLLILRELHISLECIWHSIYTRHQTMPSELLSPPRPKAPRTASSARTKYGPTTGTLPTNPTALASTSPKSTPKPYTSAQKPTNGQRSRISASPTHSSSVPRSLLRAIRYVNVRCGPSSSVTPISRRIWCPCQCEDRGRALRRDSRCPWLACAPDQRVRGRRGSKGRGAHSHGAVKEHHDAAQQEEGPCCRAHLALFLSCIVPRL